MLHDLIIKTIAKYLRPLTSNNWIDSFRQNNRIFVDLQGLNRRFYSIRDIFIRQISLDYELSKKVYETRPYGWNKVHSMHMRYLRDVSDLGGINSLTITAYENITGFSSLYNLRTLHLYWNHELHDVSILTQLRYLSLVGCHVITDVSALKNIHTLRLYDCAGITDVSALGNIHTLTLIECPGIRDVSALKNIHTLSIIRCSGVRDYSVIRGRHHKLVIASTQTLYDLWPFANVYHLELDDIDLLAYCLSDLNEVHTLTLIHCRLLYHIPPLSKSIQNLSISYCHNLYDISAARDIPNLEITHCRHIRNIFGRYFAITDDGINGLLFGGVMIGGISLAIYQMVFYKP